jgi:hypothetical protein
MSHVLDWRTKIFLHNLIRKIHIDKLDTKDRLILKSKARERLLYLNISHYALTVCLNHAAVYRIFLFHKCEEIAWLSDWYLLRRFLYYEVSCFITHLLKSLEREKYKHYGFPYSLARDSFQLQCCRTKYSKCQSTSEFNIQRLEEGCWSRLDVRGSVHHSIIHIENPTRWNSSSKFLFRIYMKLNMFRATHGPSLGA